MPVFRFGSPKSFSLILFDFTFNTDDGGLHIAMGLLTYPFLLLLILPEMPKIIYRRRRLMSLRLKRSQRKKVNPPSK